MSRACLKLDVAGFVRCIHIFLSSVLALEMAENG